MLDAGQASPSAPTTPLVAPLDGTRLAAVAPSRQDKLLLDMAASPVRTLKPNVDLVRDGERANAIHVIRDGWLCRYKIMHDGRRQIVALLVPGDVASLDVLLHERANTGVRTLTTATVTPLPRDRVLALADRHTGVAMALARLALTENAMLDRQAVRLGRQSSRQRLGHLLCELAHRLVANPGRAVTFDLPITQEHLADALGLTSVHVNRTLQQLRADGLVRLAGRTATICDLPRVAEEAEFRPGYLLA